MVIKKIRYIKKTKSSILNELPLFKLCVLCFLVRNQLECLTRTVTDGRRINMRFYSLKQRQINKHIEDTQTDGQTDKRTYRHTDRLTNERTDVRTYERYAELSTSITKTIRY